MIRKDYIKKCYEVLVNINKENKSIIEEYTNINKFNKNDLINELYKTSKIYMKDIFCEMEDIINDIFNKLKDENQKLIEENKILNSKIEKYENNKLIKGNKMKIIKEIMKRIKKI